MIYWVLPSFTDFDLVLLGLTKISWVLPSVSGFYRLELVFNLALLGFHDVDSVSIGFYRFRPIITGLYLVLLGFYRVLLVWPPSLAADAGHPRTAGKKWKTVETVRR